VMSPAGPDGEKRERRGPADPQGLIARAGAVLAEADVRRLLGARFTSQVSEGLFLAAVLNTLVFLPERQSTLTGLALATALTLLPFSILEPAVGVFVDRWRRQRILVVTALLRACVALLVLSGIPVLVYAATFVIFSANRIYQTTVTAVTPRVLGATDHARLFDANTALAIAGTVALFGGTVAGGLLAERPGTPLLVALVCLFWIGAALVSASLSGSLPPRGATGGAVRTQLGTAIADLGDGFLRIGRTPAALVPILTVAVGQFLQVLIIAVSLVALREGLEGGIVTFSGLVAAGGAGVLAGFVTVTGLGRRVPSSALIGVAFFLSALAVVPPVISLSAATLSVGALLLGLSYAWARVPCDTLAQRAVPDRYRGRVFAAMDLGFNTSRVLGAVVAVPLVPLLGPQATVAVAAVVFLLWGVAAPRWLRTRKVDEPAA